MSDAHLPARPLRSDSCLSIHYVQIDRLGYAMFRVCRNIGLIRFVENTTFLLLTVYVCDVWPECWPRSYQKPSLLPPSQGALVW
jgi:hypothetical protein